MKVAELLCEDEKPSATAKSFAQELGKHILDIREKRNAHPGWMPYKVHVHDKHHVQLEINDFKTRNFLKTYGMSKDAFFDKISEFSGHHGWDIGHVTVDDEGHTYYEFYPERDESTRLTNHGDLYHVTVASKVNTILKDGLKPSSAGVEAINKESDWGGTFGGVFKNKVFVVKNPYSGKKFTEAFKNLFDNLHLEGKMAVVKIDADKLPSDTKFYIDHTILDDDYKKVVGYWTRTPIPADALSVQKV